MSKEVEVEAKNIKCWCFRCHSLDTSILHWESVQLVQNRDAQVIVYTHAYFKNKVLETGAEYREYSYFPKDNLENLPDDRWAIFKVINAYLRMTSRILPEMVSMIEGEAPDIVVYDHQAIFVLYIIEYLRQWKNCLVMKCLVFVN